MSEASIAAMAVEVRAAVTREVIGYEVMETNLRPRGEDGGLALIAARVLAEGRQSIAVLTAAHDLLRRLSPYEGEVRALLDKQRQRVGEAPPAA